MGGTSLLTTFRIVGAFSVFHEFYVLYYAGEADLATRSTSTSTIYSVILFNAFISAG